MAAGRSTWAGILAATLGAAGCCATGPAHGSGDRRDTPEEAVAAIRRAFAEDDVGAQYDALHPDLIEREGLSESRYRLARTLHPDLFARVAAALSGAGDPVVERGPGPMATSRGPRAWARVRLESPSGQGVFVLVDEPGFLLVTDDEDVPERPGALAGFEEAVRIEGGALVVRARVPLGDVAPRDGAEIRRVEFRRRWLVHGIEALDGFDDLVRGARSAAEDADRGRQR